LVNHSGSIDRYLEARGITGRNSTVVIVDDFLDVTSTFFYDASAPVGRGHRKIVYSEFATPENESHGTHIAGVVAGDSPEENAAPYNGVAPGARIAHIAVGKTPNASRIVDVMRAFDAHVACGSWGFAEWLPERLAEFDEAGGLFVWAAANRRTIGSPEQAKNVVAVGALAQLEVDGMPGSQLLYAVVDSSGPFRQLYPHGMSVSVLEINFGRSPFNETVSVFEGVLTTQIEAGKVAVIHDQEEFLARILSSGTPISAMISGTDFASPAHQIKYATFCITDPDFWTYAYPLIAAGENFTIKVVEQYRQIYELSRRLEGSALGPSATGVLKPDLVASGTNILSASSKANGRPHHDVNPLKLVLASGTSVAAANVAGAVALIDDYCHHQLLVNCSATLLKALLINSAEPMPNGTATPNIVFGFGEPNLGKWLPIEGDHLALWFANDLHAHDRQHWVSSAQVVSRAEDLRVTIAYFDRAAAPDSKMPLVADLDLIVVSPSKKVYRGNHIAGGQEEHFSTVERVIVPRSEVEFGTYQVHLIAALVPGVVPPVSFSVAAAGGLNKSRNFAFHPATACATSCGAGICREPNFLCQCPDDLVGQSCQTKVLHLNVSGVEQATVFTLNPSAAAYFRFNNGKGAKTEIRVQPIRNEGLSVRVFTIEEKPSPFLPRDFTDVVVREDAEGPLVIHTKTRTFSLMVRNDFDVPRNFNVSCSIPGKSKKVPLATVIGICIGVVGIALVVVVAVCLCRKKQQPQSEPYQSVDLH
jgi:hypothetical protein